ncbi:MAG: hypothetical protein ABIY70_26600 [Capsulimonas sp.]|uniref:hypothetical protein n=1 Tax=Capsulimonas sp. TaxID=2494211 RepID=UPI0032630D72
MSTTKSKTIVGLLGASLALAAVVHAQGGQTKPAPGKSAMGEMKSEGMMGPMNMSGHVMMNGQPCMMKCDMTPMGKSKGMGGHSMTGMHSMKMHKPMKMSGTMSMMGQNYHCDMTMMSSPTKTKK